MILHWLATLFLWVIPFRCKNLLAGKICALMIGSFLSTYIFEYFYIINDFTIALKFIMLALGSTGTVSDKLVRAQNILTVERCHSHRNKFKYIGIII